MIVYLTFGEKVSGVYKGQVMDVCDYLSELKGEPVKLVSIISMRNFREERMKIRQSYSNSIVLPMFPTLRLWKWNIILLFFVCLFRRNIKMICRNSIPGYFGLRLRKLGLVKSVTLDGRGAEYEQYIEFNMVPVPLAEKLRKVESKSVNEADFRISVTRELVEYWKRAFDYKGQEHLIIPCTLNRHYLDHTPKKRTELGYKEEDVIITYSGSVAGWQSFGLMYDFLSKHLGSKPELKLMLLTKQTSEVERLMEEFPDQVKCLWVPVEEVTAYLSVADYGLLIRDDSVTNEVAFPVKFGEYLQAGLKVIVTRNIKDVANFVKEHHCGLFPEEIQNLDRATINDREAYKKLAADYLAKGSPDIEQKYKVLLKNIG